MKRLLSLTTAAAMAAGTVVVALAGAAPASAATLQPGAYAAITPTRALDTRDADGGGALGTGEVRKLDLSDYVETATASAVVLNLTVAAPTAAGFLTVYPDDATRPLASSINFRAGEIRSNSVTVALPTDSDAAKTVDIYNLVGSTQVVVDVIGFYDPDLIGNAATYLPESAPFRALDTREKTPAGITSGNGVDVTVPAPEDGDLGGVTSVAVNVTAVDPTGQGFLTAYNGDGDAPLVSTVNYGTDPVTPNFAIVPVQQANDNTITFRVDNSGSTTGIVVDVVGYYSESNANGALYVPVTPSRITDTRTNGAKPIAGGSTRDFSTFAPVNGVQALNLNLTAADATTGTYLTAFASGTTRPVVSNLNPFTPAALANAAQPEVTPDDSGNASVSFSVYNLAGSVNFVADLQGFFVALD